MKKILLFLSLLTTGFGFSQELEWVPFQWVKSWVSGRYLDKSAIRIPVTLDSLPHLFTMQLDLGTLTTAFSGNAIDPYLETYPPLKNKMDTTRHFFAHGKKNPMLTGVDLHLGTYVFKKTDIGYHKGYGRIMEKDAIDQKTEVRIGTIGTDLFQDKILILDFRKERLAVTEQLPTSFQDLEFVKFEKEHGRIKLPFQIDEKQERVLFDTGASFFALSTTEERAKAISDSVATDSLHVPSWGKYLTLYGLKIKKPLYLGTHKLKEATVYYEKTRRYDSFFTTENVWGLTGNVFFLESTVVIDYKHNLFGVKWD